MEISSVQFTSGSPQTTFALSLWGCHYIIWDHMTLLESVSIHRCIRHHSGTWERPSPQYDRQWSVRQMYLHWRTRSCPVRVFVCVCVGVCVCLHRHFGRHLSNSHDTHHWTRTWAPQIHLSVWVGVCVCDVWGCVCVGVLCLSSDHLPLYTSPVLYVNSPSPQRSSSTQSPWATTNQIAAFTSHDTTHHIQSLVRPRHCALPVTLCI